MSLPNGMEPTIKITVIIPTRERCDTLQAALQTCVTQDYGDLEILVSDNFSQDQTREIVAAVNDKRLRYINTGQRVGMSANWEFALSHVNSGYVMFLGDDDGLMPKAISRMAEVLRTLEQPAALGLGRAVYYWPNYPNATRRNTLMIGEADKITTLDSAAELKEVAAIRRSWGALPGIYRSLIRQDIVEVVKQRSGGRFFNSAIPDVYSAVAVACVIPTYNYSLNTYTLEGVSGHSIGNSFLNRHVHAQPAQRFLAENEIKIHPRMVMSSSSAVCVAECVLQAQDLGLTPSDLTLDLQTVIRAALREASEAADGVYAAVLEDVRQIGVRNHLEDFVAEAISHAAHSAAAEGRPLSGHNLRRGGLTVDCSPHGVRNVYEASLLCDRILHAEPWRHWYPVGTLQLTFREFMPFIKKHLKRTWRRFTHRPPP